MTNKSHKLATFAAGCFWHVEEMYRTLPGVIETMVGYSGGDHDSPTYEDVGTGDTGHAESVQITYDPEAVSYEQLLEVFWNGHDPTQVDRQGSDIGTQYRSIIFYHDDDQKKAAEESKAALEASGKYNKPIATHLLAAMPFHKAEEYHQKYFLKTGRTTC